MGYVYLDNLKRIGKVDSDGYIYSENLDRLGKIQSDGRIYDENLTYVGKIDSDGYIYLSNMKRVGRIHRDGYVYDEFSNRVGKLDSDIVDFIFNKASGSGRTENASAATNVTGSNSTGTNGMAVLILAVIIIVVGLLILSTLQRMLVPISMGMVTAPFSISLLIFIGVSSAIICAAKEEFFLGGTFLFGWGVLTLFFFLVTIEESSRENVGFLTIASALIAGTLIMGMFAGGTLVLSNLLFHLFVAIYKKIPVMKYISIALLIIVVMVLILYIMNGEIEIWDVMKKWNQNLNTRFSNEI